MRLGHEIIRSVTPTTVQRWAESDRDQTRALVRSPEFWQAVLGADGLHVTTGAPARQRREDWIESALDLQRADEARDTMLAEGYTRAPIRIHPERCHALGNTIITLCRLGWDAALIPLLDEVWSLSHHLSAEMDAVLDAELSFRGEVFAFCVDPRLATGRERGVPPHRDRIDSGFSRIGGVVLPRHCTTWVSLTDATEANGCMHVVPATKDAQLRGTSTEAPEESEATPLETSRGDVLAWSGQVLHFGGTYDVERAEHPRVALAMSLTHGALYSDGGPTPRDGLLPTFEQRRQHVTRMIRWLTPPEPGSPMDAVLELMEDA